MELIKAHMQRFDNTRRIQWTFNGLFWSGIIIATPFLKDIMSDQFQTYDLLPYQLVILGSYSIILYLFQHSLNWDKDRFKNYRSHLESIIDVNFKDNDKFPWWIIWTGAQFLVTFLLLLGVHIIMNL